MKKKYDAIVIGSGPNGLAAAIKLAQANRSVALFEAKNTIGGGMRSAELTLPGFTHDICSAIHPLAFGSPFFRSLPLKEHGLQWVHPPAAIAHPLDDGTAVLLERSIADTVGYIDSCDTHAYKNLIGWLVNKWPLLENDLLAPLGLPKHPLLMAKFGWLGIHSAMGLANSKFSGDRARSLFAGMAAHSMLPLDRPLTAAIGLILCTLGHTTGWPFPRHGTQKLADALGALFLSLGGDIHTDSVVENLDQLPPSNAILCDITPKQLIHIAGQRLPSGYKTRLENYRYGPGVFKVDWALNAPIPWKAKECARAATVHIGGNAEEIALSEKQIWQNICPEKPFIILAQQSLFDPSRAPAGKHTAWGYCHVPNGSTEDMTQRIENQIERFAPGFKDCILARHTMSPKDLEAYNSNYIGGDINGGVQDLFQLFTRPVARFVPYSTPVGGLYICSASTPPGGGVHGMCGYHAAQAVLNRQ